MDSIYSNLWAGSASANDVSPRIRKNAESYYSDSIMSINKSNISPSFDLSNISLFGFAGQCNPLASNSQDNFSSDPIMASINEFQQLMASFSTPFPLKYNGASKDTQFNTNTNLSALKDVYNPKISNQLAQIAYDNATKADKHGKCAKYANNSIEDCGIVSKNETRTLHAYDVAKLLAKNENFSEVKDISRDDLDHLPAGCVIIWDKSAGHDDGHMTITLGDGREASDHIIDHIYKPDAAFRVFVPVAKK